MLGGDSGRMLHLAEVDAVVDSQIVLGVPLLRPTPSQKSIASELSDEAAEAMGISDQRRASRDMLKDRESPGARRTRSWSPNSMFKPRRWRPTGRNVIRTLLAVKKHARHAAAAAAAQAAVAVEHVQHVSESMFRCCCLEVVVRQ